MGQYFASNFTFFFCLTWLFPYLQRTYDLQAMQAGLLSSAPLIGGAIGNWVGGSAVDGSIDGDAGRSRASLPAVIGFVLAAAGLLGSLAADGMYAKVLLLSIAVFGADMTLPPSWAFCIDIGRSDAGVVSGHDEHGGQSGLVRDEPGVSVPADLDRLAVALLHRRRNAQRRRGNSVDASASRSADCGRSGLRH